MRTCIKTFACGIAFFLSAIFEFYIRLLLEKTHIQVYHVWDTFYYFLSFAVIFFYPTCCPGDSFFPLQLVNVMSKVCTQLFTICSSANSHPEHFTLTLTLGLLVLLSLTVETVYAIPPTQRPQPTSLQAMWHHPVSNVWLPSNKGNVVCTGFSLYAAIFSSFSAIPCNLSSNVLLSCLVSAHCPCLVFIVYFALHYLDLHFM